MCVCAPIRITEMSENAERLLMGGKFRVMYIYILLFGGVFLHTFSKCLIFKFIVSE